MSEKQTTTNQTTRRGFLDWIVAACSTATAALLAIPAVMYLWPAARGGTAENVEVPEAGSMPPGQSRMVQVGGKAVIVVRDASGFRAYSAACTHLGCLVKWDAAHRQFLCPCHAGVFDDKGAVVSGPAPAPLPPYKTKEIGGKVYVSGS